MTKTTPRVRVRRRKPNAHSNFQRINQPRVEKLLKMIEVIETSAKSNRAGQSEVDALLEPVKAALGGAETGTSSLTQRVTPGVPVPGLDRHLIRKGLHALYDGDVSGGARQIRDVVLGWVVPDKID